MMRKLSFVFIIIFSLSYRLEAAVSEELLTWKECLIEAQENHPDLISAQETITQSVADREITKSGLLPQITTEVSASTAKAASKSKASDTYTYSASGSQLIFDAFKTAYELKAASQNIKASQQAFRYTSSTVRLRLRTAFINLFRAQEKLKVAEDIFQIRRSNLELITLRYESGLEHRGALLTAQANLAQAQLDIEMARRDFEVSQHELTKEMGRTSFRPIRVEATFDLKKEKEKPDFNEIIKNNPLLLQAAYQKNAASFGVKSAISDFLPQVSGQASAGKTGSRWAPRNYQWDAGFTLSMPIFEGGLKTAQLDQAKSLLRQYEANQRSARDSALYSLEQTWAALEDAIDTVTVQKKFLEATEERSRIAEAQYSLGLIQFDNWTIIQDDLVRAKENLLDSQANALLTQASWVQAKGETLEYVE